MLLVGVGGMEGAGHLALGRGRKGESAKATASAQRTGGGGGGRAGKVRPQEHPKPGETSVYPSAWNQHECWKEPGFVSSRAGRQEGWKGRKQEPACHCMLHPTLRAS